MLVVIANNLPPAVRGRMKLWFIEPKPHVFVSGIKDNVAKKVVDYLLEHCPSSSGLIVFERTQNAPGYRMYGSGNFKRQLVEISGMHLVHEKDT